MKAVVCHAAAHSQPALFLLCCIAVLLGDGPAVRAQSALDGFDPNPDFSVRAVAAQADGKILIGGEFTSLSPNGGAAVIRNRIARLNPNGSLDTTFDPNANESVNVIVVQPDGKILIAGDFTTLAPSGGAAVVRNRIARLNPNGSLDTAFNPNANAVVSAITVQADGKILVGGAFTGANSIGGQTRNCIARLDATTGAADSFNPNATTFAFTPSVGTIAVQADGKILVGGFFNNIGGQTRNRIARLDAATGAADSFDPNASAVGGGSVSEIAVQPDGKVLVGGVFTTVGGQSRNCIARLDPATGAADSWNPNPDNAVHAMAVQPDGRVLIGGDFASVGGMTTFMARLDPVTGAPEAGFNPGTNERVVAIAVQADGKILAGGFFTSAGGATRSRIARLETDGRLDRTLNLNAVAGYILATAVQPDGKIVIGGAFSSVLSVPRNNIARLHPDGTLDTQFSPNPNGDVAAIAVQYGGDIVLGGSFTTVLTNGSAPGSAPAVRNRIARVHRHGGLDPNFNPNANGDVRALVVSYEKILVGGEFTSIGGATRNRIARLDHNGTFDEHFDPNASSAVFSIALQADGKILVGGQFTSIGGETRNYLARLEATFGVADAFNPNPNEVLRCIAVQPDGKILVAGLFTHVGGMDRNRIARLDAATGAADSFNPNANSAVLSIAVQADGKILVGGAFAGVNSIGGQTRSRIARLNGATGAADSFDPSANNMVYAIALQADGKILAGGEFTGIGGQTRNRFARLNNDTAALQNLAVTHRTITWSRGGSSPQFGVVRFALTTNQQNYFFLANGTSSGADWSVTGLNLPTGENFYIQALNWSGSGLYNGSQNLTEAVRNAFLIPLVVPSSVVSRKTHGPDADPLKTFDIDLPLSGTPLGVECRRSTRVSNLGSDHEVVFTFPTAISVGGASVTSNIVGDNSYATFSVNSNQVTVYLHEIANAPRRLTINLTNVSDGTNANNVSIPMGILFGDTTGNSFVNSGDALQTKNRSGQPTAGTNFRSDVNLDDTINSGDALIVRSRSGHFIP